MLKAIIAACLSRRALVIFGLLAFAVAGLYAFKSINIESYPNPTPVILEITAEGPGLSAEEIERYYTIPMEIGLYATPDVQIIRSTSFYGLAFVRVVFKWGIDYDFARAQATLALQQNVTLPGGQVPAVNQNSGSGEIYRYTVEGPDRYSLTDLRTIQDWIVARRLSTIAGVINVNSWGGTTKEFEVQVDPLRLEAFNLTVPQVLSALGNANINVGGREITVGQQSINIRGIGLIDDGGNDDLTQGYHLGDIEKVVLGQFNGVPVLMRDVAQVRLTHAPRLGIFGKDRNDDAVGAIVVMTRTKKTSEVLPLVKAEVARMNSDGSLPPGVKVVPFYDRSDLIALTTRTVVHNLLFGVALVFMVQWLFLGNLRSAIVVGVNIPFALFFALMLLVWQHQSANLLSIGAVDFGIIVDAAVIMTENIFRNLQRPGTERRNLLAHLAGGLYGTDPTATQRSSPQGWTDRLRLILISALQVDRAILFSTLVTAAGFVPLFTMEGVEGQIFGPMARTYGFALAGSLIATFTVTPVLSLYLLPERLEEAETLTVRLLHRVYDPVLRFALSRRGLIVGSELALIALTALLIAPRLGSEFLPALEENNYWIRASMPTTLSLEAGEAATRKMRLILLRHPEVITVTSQHGRPDNGTDAAPFSNVELFVPLKPLGQWPAGVTKGELTAQIQRELQSELPGVIFNFSQYIQDNIEEAISGVKGANSVKILGRNLTTLEMLAHRVQDEMSKVRGIADLGIFPVLGQPNLNIRIDRDRIARFGLNTGDVNTVIQAAMAGAAATQVLEGDREWNLVVRYPPQYRDSIGKIRDIKVGYTTASGTNAYVPLSELASITLDTGASWIYHETMVRFIPVKFSVRGRDLAGAVAEAQSRIAHNVSLPSGYRVVWSGEFEDLQLAKERLEFAVPVSLMLIVALLYALFNSMRDTLLSLAGIPVGVIGGVWALWLTGQPFSISAAIGFVSLFGVSVMNSILVLTFYNQARAEGLPPAEAIYHAATKRMRPLLMTSLSACIGLLPAAISHGIGSQVQRPLATVIVGGMLFGPILLLLAVPPLRMVFAGHETRVREPQ
jgi:heavy metal efflux system protein